MFVLTDDLSSELARFMPHVQALARRGTSFSNYIVSDSLCCPSRASIFTGRFPHNTDILRNEPPHGGFETFLQRGEESQTFAMMLQRAGYRTAFFGKYLNDYTAYGLHVPPGWTQWDGVGNGYLGNWYDANENGHLLYPAAFVNTWMQDGAQAFLRSARRQRRPFFLEVATFTPHYPYTPAPADVGTFRWARAPRNAAYNRVPRHPPQWLAHRAPLTRAVLRRQDFIERLRVEAVQSVDRMLAALQKTAAVSGELDNTIFVFSSDNGLHLATHGLQAGKSTAFDTDVRVPLLIAGPGVAVGRVVDAVTQNVDLAPTFEQMARARVPGWVDGRSLVPLLRGRPVAWRAAALVEHLGPHPAAGDPDRQGSAAGDPPSYRALRTATFTYVSYSSGEIEYYDLVADPLELDNVARQLTLARRQVLAHWLAALSRCKAARCWAAARQPP